MKITRREANHKQNEIEVLLRLTSEPCVYINELQAHQAVMDGCHEFMDLLLDFFRAWSRNETTVDMPRKDVFCQERPRGDFRLMPCIMPGENLKFVKVIGTNEEERTVKDKICVGKSLLIDYYDNHVYALIDVCALSSFRTAAASVLAMHLCGKAHVAPIGLIGMGRIGFYTAYILNQWLGTRAFSATDVNEQNQNNFKELCDLYLPEAEVSVGSFREVVETSSALFLSTTSSRALLNAANAAHPDYISSVGADADNLSEVDHSLLDSHRLITDSLQSMGLGDMKRWQDGGRLTPAEVTDLCSLMRESPTKNQSYLFISTGIAVLDVLINRFVFEKVDGRELATL